MGEFACTRRPVLGTPALAAEMPWRKTQQAEKLSGNLLAREDCARVRMGVGELIFTTF
jgi:hypothetical protein